MKRIALFAAVLSIAASCSMKEMETGSVPAPQMFGYTEEDQPTKTAITVDGEGVGTIWWKPADNINVFFGTTSVRYCSTNEVDATTVVFETSTMLGSTESASDNKWGLYPYNSAATCDGASVTTTIPAAQQCVPGTFGNNLFPMIAHTSTNELQFKNVCGGIKFSLSRNDIKKITFCGTYDEPIAGEVKISLDNDVPVAEIIDRVSTITLTPSDRETFEAGKNYYIVMLPNTFYLGFTMSFFTDTEKGTFKYEGKTTIKRSVFSKKANIDTYAEFSPMSTTKADLSGDTMLPEGVDKTTITEVYFHTLSDKTTEYPLGTDKGYEPAYFELEGTVANYYTSAGCFAPVGMDGMFQGWTSLRHIDFTGVNTSAVYGMSCLFRNCSSLDSIDLSDFDTSNVTDMSGMFEGCAVKSLDLSNFNTSKVENMSTMFSSMPNIETLDLSNFDTSNVKSTNWMFSFSQKLKSVDLSSFNTRTLTQTACMFYGCNGLETLDLSSFDTSKVEDMQFMFASCSSLTELNLSSFNTSNVTNMSAMFVGCYSLPEIPIQSFDTSHVTDMEEMFGAIGNAKIDLSNFDTSSAKDMSYMFRDNSSKELDLSGLNTSNVENMRGMFSNCSALESLNLSAFNTSKVQLMSNMFFGCKALKSLDLSSFDMLNVNGISGMCEDLASDSQSCTIKCSPATKQILKYYKTNMDTQFIIWDLTDGDTLYESSDFSYDGRINSIQTASVGNGIDIVFVGDAYSDKSINEGTYDNDVSTAVEAFFGVEPYKSLRSMFNIHEIYAVSPFDYLVDSALGTYIGAGTDVEGDDSTVQNYVRRAIPGCDLNNTLIIVLINKTTYAGTTYMYYPESSEDYAPGLAIAYLSRGTSDEEFVGLVQHEAGGHGFAKLADEYFYHMEGITLDSERISESEKSEAREMMEYGWYSNIDFTNNPTEVKWHSFLYDSRYASENLGVYEGGFVYTYGVWRPSENSIMKQNTGGFNAPSRQAIYYRANKLAFGPSWTYNHEEFVQFDRSVSGAGRERMAFPKANNKAIKATPRPIVVKNKQIN